MGRFAITSGRSESVLAVVAYVDAYDADDALNRYADILETNGRPAFWNQDEDGRNRLDVRDADFPFYARPDAGTVNEGNVERRGRWTVALPSPSAPLSPALAGEIDKLRNEDSPRRKSPAPMLDPSWTPAKGYGHALAIFATLERKENGQ